MHKRGITSTIDFDVPASWLPADGDTYFTPDLQSAEGSPIEMIWSGSYDDYYLLVGKRVHDTIEAATLQQDGLKRAIMFMLA